MIRLRLMAATNDQSAGVRDLIRAARSGKSDTIREVLLAAGVDVNASVVGHDGVTALIAACLNGHVVCVRLLLLVPETDVNVTTDSGCTALMAACQEGHRECVDALLRTGNVDVNHAEASGSTALMLAAHYGHETIVALLLECEGVDVCVSNCDGFTALHAAAQGGATSIVYMLITAGADASATNRFGLTARAIATRTHGGDHAITKMTASAERICSESVEFEVETDDGEVLVVVAQQGWRSPSDSPREREDPASPHELRLRVECEMAAERLREAEAKAAAAEARATAAEARVAQLNTLSPSEEGYRLCLVCHERPRERAPPCGHCCVCSDCANHTAVKFTCPVCREPIPAGEWRPVFL